MMARCGTADPVGHPRGLLIGELALPAARPGQQGAGGAAHARRVHQAAERRARAAPAHHPDDADRAAALRHAAALAARPGRRAAGARPLGRAAAGARRSPPPDGRGRTSSRPRRPRAAAVPSTVADASRARSPSRAARPTTSTSTSRTSRMPVAAATRASRSSRRTSSSARASAVVQTGTNVVFPNLDSVFHNVFSNSPRNTLRPRHLPRRRQAALGHRQRARASSRSSATSTRR